MSDKDFLGHRLMERRLEEELPDEAELFEALGGRELHLDEVLSRAGGIRRKRRTLTGLVAAAAVVALVVPAGVILADRESASGPGPLTHPTAPASTSPSASPSPTPSTTTDPGSQPAPGVLDVSHLPTGDAPRLDYLQDGLLHFADGGTGAVRTHYTPRQFVEMSDGSRVWQTVDHGTPYVEIQDPDGYFHGAVRSRFGLAIDPTHTISAWLSPSGHVTVWEGRATDPRPFGEPVPGSDLRLGPVIGNDCSLACSVVVNVRDREGQPWEVRDSGTQPLRDGGYLSISDSSEAGLSIGLTRVTDVSTCSKLLGGGEFVGFSTCRNQLSSFSPDGRLILALPSYFDGTGPTGIGMYDLSGKRLFERSSTVDAQAWFTDAAWEDDTHVLAPVFQGGRWAVVRIGSDGRMEYAVPPVASTDDVTSPFVLPVR
jgi:hypothetical protein